MYFFFRDIENFSDSGGEEEEGRSVIFITFHPSITGNQRYGLFLCDHRVAMLFAQLCENGKIMRFFSNLEICTIDLTASNPLM